MTITEITKVQAKANIKFETAKKIRALLDEARKEYGSTDWSNDDMETLILDLVTEE